MHPEDVNEVEQILDQLKQGNSINYRFRIITPKGEIKFLAGTGSLIEVNNASIADWDETTSRQELELKIFQHAEQVSDSGTWTWNLLTDEFYCTDNMYKIFGLNRGDGNIGLAKFSEIIHPDDLQQVMDHFASIKQLKQDIEIDFRINVPSGETRYLKTKAELFATRKGVEYFIGTAQDVTREVLAEARVRESEAQVRQERLEAENRIRAHEALMKEAEMLGGMGSYEAQLPTMDIFFSDNMYRLLGFKPGAFKPTLDFLDTISVAEDAKMVRVTIARAVETKSDYEYTRRVFHPNGQMRYIHSNGRIILDEKGIPVKIIGIVKDVTQQHAFEVALKEKQEEQEKNHRELKASKERFEAAINVSPNVLSILRSIRDENNQIVDFLFEWVSKSGEELSGKDVTGLRLTEQFPHTKEFNLFDKFVLTVETGKPTEVEHYYGDKGFDLWACWKAVKFDDGLFVSLENNTKRKKGELELKESRDLLQSVVNALPHGFSVLEAVRDHEGIIRDFRYRFANITTQTLVDQGELIGQTFSVLHKGFEQHGFFEELVQVVNSGDQVVTEFTYDEGESERSFKTTIVKLRDGVVLSFEDITAYKRAAQDVSDQKIIGESLRKREAELARIQRIGGVAGFDVEVSDLQSSAPSPRSHEYKILHGLPEHQNYETHDEWLSRIYPEDRERAEKTLREAIASARSFYESEYRIIRPVDGQIKWIYAKVDIERDEQGTPTRLVGAHIDITARKNLEEQLRKFNASLEDLVAQRTAELKEEHKRFKEAQAVGHIGSFEWNAKTDKIYWSDEMYRIHQLEPQSEEITLERIVEFVHPEDRALVYNKILSHRKSAGRENLIHRLKLKNNEVRYINRHFESFADENGNVIRLSGTIQDITEIKQAEEQLKKNLQILKQAEEVAEIGSWEFDIDEDKFNWSEGMYRIFSMVNGTSVSPESYLEYVIEQDRPVVENLIQAIRRGQNPFEETIRIKVNGEIRTIKVKGNVLYNEKGKPTKMLGVDMDVTDLVESQKQLRQNEKLLTSVFDATPVGISLLTAVRDEDNRIIDFKFDLINRTAEEQFHATYLTGKQYKSALPPEIATSFFNKFVEVVGGKKTLQFEGEYRLGDRRVWLNISTAKIEDGLLVVSEDVTLRKHIEEQIHNQSLLFTRVIESVPDVIQLVNVESGKATYLNKMLLEDLGYPFSMIKKIESEKEGIRALIHAEDLEKYNVFKERMHTAGDDETVEVEVRVCAYDKSWRWFKIRSKVFERDKNGSVVKYIAFSQNITRAKQAEEERKNHQMLVEMDKAKTAFFANVSHEFRTPLTLLLAPLEDVVRNGGTTLAKQELDKLRMAHRNALRLQKLVNTLLDFSRIEAGRADAIFQPTDLAKYTMELASNFTSLFENAGLKYVMKIEDPEEPIYVNREMYEKIVLNLLSNAFKFTFKGKIEIILRANKKHVQLHVRDTGIGISKDNLARIFERFARIEGVKSRTYEGSGIGLALVRELVLMHGGSIKVDSAEGEGTTFMVVIPRGKAHLPPRRIFESKDRVANGSVASSFLEELSGWLPVENVVFDNRNRTKLLARDKSQKDLRKPRILLVDDNADMRGYMHSLLCEDYEVVMAENGKKAIEAIQPGKMPDLVLSDVMMPEVDGYQLLAAIKSNSVMQHIPVILLSARADEEAKIEGMRYGADDYLIKPFSAKEMLARIDARIQIARMQKKTEEYLIETNKQLEMRVRERTKELQESKKQLEVQRNLLQQTLDAIPQMIWLSDATGKIKLINDQWFRYTGLAHEHFQNVRIDELDVIHPSQTKEIFPLLQKTMSEGLPYHTEVLVKNKGGEYLWHMKVVVPVYEESGAVAYWVGSLIDVHEQFTHEKKIKEYKDLLEAVFNSSFIGIQVLDALYNENHQVLDFEWKLFNKAIQRLAKQMDLKGKRFIEVFPGAMQSGLFERLKEVIHSGEPAHFQQFYNYEGFDNWYDISAVKLEDSVVMTISDISESKASQLELQRINESLAHKNHELKMLNEELSTFAFVASHDLREPLRKIQIFSQVLVQREEQNLSEGGKDFFRRIMSAIQRMNSLIDDILTYSRANAGPKELVKTDLNKVLFTVKSDLSEYIRERKAVVEAHELPHLKCNPLQMGQLLQNLISNAIKFQPKDNIPHIVISASIVDGKNINHPMASPLKRFVKLEVKDNGIGFEQEYEAKIFQMFQRLHGMAEFAGTGMGLAICKKIVENHKGFIAAESKPGEGAMFSCYFPDELTK
nr:PAS domain-containing protein [Chryseosolibacter indicus]